MSLPLLVAVCFDDRQICARWPLGLSHSKQGIHIEKEKRTMGNSSSNPESPKSILQKGCGWVADNDRAACFHCEKAFTVLSVRRHHCRLCGEVFCDSTECWGGKAMLPPHLFVDADPLSGGPNGGGHNVAHLPFLTTPQPVCCVCFGVLNSPLRKVALTLAENQINCTGAARSLWADSMYRKNAPEYVIHVTVLSVGHKGDDAAGKVVMYPVHRRFRLHLDAWRPFNKQTRLLFCAVDPIGPVEVEEPPSPSNGQTPRSRSGSINSGVSSPTNTSGTPAASAMRRQRRKSRTDLVLDVPTGNGNSEVTLPNRWSLGGTSVFHCELVSDPADGVRLETFSDIITIATDTTVAQHFSLSTAELYQVVKQTIAFSRVRGKVRVSSIKAPSSRLLKKSKS